MLGQVAKTRCEQVAEFVKSPRAEQAAGGILLLASGATLAVAVLKGAAASAVFGGGIGLITCVGLAAIIGIGLGLLFHGYIRTDVLKEKQVALFQQQQSESLKTSASVTEEEFLGEFSLVTEKAAEDSSSLQQPVASGPASPIAFEAAATVVANGGNTSSLHSPSKTAEKAADVAKRQLVVVDAYNKEKAEQVEVDVDNDVSKDGIDAQVEVSLTAKSEEIVVTSSKKSVKEEGFSIDRLFGETPYVDTDATKQTIEATKNLNTINTSLRNPTVLDFKETYFNSEKDAFLSKAFSLLEAFVDKQNRSENEVAENIYLNDTWCFLEEGFEKSSLYILKAAAVRGYKSSSLSFIQKHLEIVRKSLESDTFEPLFRRLDGRDPFKDLVLAAKALTTDPEKLQILDQSLGLKNGDVNSQVVNGVEAPLGTKSIPAASLGIAETFRIVGSIGI